MGTVRAPERLDDRAWLARLEVDTVLAGEAAAGESLAIAWDERIPGRPRRFDDGGRILVALEPLPGWSIWRERLGDRPALGIALRGGAFLRDPSPATLALVQRFLQVPPPRRDAADGVEALAAIVAEGPPPLARDALARLDRVPGLAGRTSPGAIEALADALRNDGRPEDLRAGLAALAAERRLEALRPALETLAASKDPLAARALDAALQLEGEVAPERIRTLLEADDPEVRAVALRRAPASMDPDPARARLDDPAGAVRAAAVESLAARRGAAALDPALDALDDGDERVRAAAIRALGGMGEAAVPHLRARVEGADVPEATAPMLALAQTGAPGVDTLRALAATHPSERVRGFARFLLGLPAEPH